MVFPLIQCHSAVVKIAGELQDTYGGKIACYTGILVQSYVVSIFYTFCYACVGLGRHFSAALYQKRVVMPQSTLSPLQLLCLRCRCVSIP